MDGDFPCYLDAGLFFPNSDTPNPSPRYKRLPDDLSGSLFGYLYKKPLKTEIGFDDFQIFVGIKANFSRKPGQCDQSTVHFGD